MKLLQSSLLSQIPSIRHGFFYPGGNGETPNRINNLSFKNGSVEDVIHARHKACGLVHLNESALTHVYQVHGTTVWNVDETQRGAGAIDGTHQIGEGDAMITNADATPLAILIADCLPVLLADKNGKAIGIVHAGWRGSLDGIVMHTVEAL